MWFWKALAEKGKIATVLGTILSIIVNSWAVFLLFSEKKVDEDTFWMIIGLNIVAQLWFILPSKMKITGKLFNLEVED